MTLHKAIRVVKLPVPVVRGAHSRLLKQCQCSMYRSMKTSSYRNSSMGSNTNNHLKNTGYPDPSQSHQHFWHVHPPFTTVTALTVRRNNGNGTSTSAAAAATATKTNIIASAVVAAVAVFTTYEYMINMELNHRNQVSKCESGAYDTKNNTHDKNNHDTKGIHHQEDERNEIKKSPLLKAVITKKQKDEYDEEEERSCPFCRFFLDSPCKESFIKWQQCVKVCTILYVDR